MKSIKGRNDSKEKSRFKKENVTTGGGGKEQKKYISRLSDWRRTERENQWWMSHGLTSHLCDRWGRMYQGCEPSPSCRTGHLTSQRPLLPKCLNPKRVNASSKPAQDRRDKRMRNAHVRTGEGEMVNDTNHVFLSIPGWKGGCSPDLVMSMNVCD
jgi:hypothetical protein